VLETLTSVVVFGLIVYFTRATHDDHAWYWLGIVNGTLAGTGGLVYWLQHDQLPYIDPNAWGRFPIMALFSMCLAVGSGSMQRRGTGVFILLAGTNFIWILLTGSRGATLVGACCAIYVIWQIPGVMRRIAWVSSAVLFCATLAVPFADRVDFSLKRANLLFDSRESIRGRTSGRSDLARDGWHIFADHPLLGVGTGGFSNARMERNDRSGTSRFTNRKLVAHSAWIKTLAENGLIGIVLLCGYVSSFVLLGWRRRHQGLFTFGLVVSTVLGLAFLSSELSNIGLWFLGAGATVLLDHKTFCSPKSVDRRESTLEKLGEVRSPRVWG
jgi:hypothetical protein